MLFAKVRKGSAEQIRQQLIRCKALAKGYVVVREGQFIYFPVVKRVTGAFELVEREAEKLPPKYTKLEDALSGFLTEEESEQLITSFDVIGDLVMVEIPEALEPKEKQIAKAILSVHKNCRTVAKKTGAMSGEFRVRPLKVIAGENNTETVYKEHGVRMKLDPSKVYFSVRLSTERKRIADQVKPGERILALFAGVGPFPLVISRFHPDAEIVAIELNPDAVEYMQQNTRLNKTTNIKTILGDAREVVLKNYRNWADRVLMPLPKSADEFLDVAIAGVKDGGIVHFYGFAHESEWQIAYENKIADAARTQNSRPMERRNVPWSMERENLSIGHKTIGRKIVRPYSPGVVQVAIDFRIWKR